MKTLERRSLCWGESFHWRPDIILLWRWRFLRVMMSSRSAPHSKKRKKRRQDYMNKNVYTWYIIEFNDSWITKYIQLTTIQYFLRLGFGNNVEETAHKSEILSITVLMMMTLLLFDGTIVLSCSVVTSRVSCFNVVSFWLFPRRCC